MRNDWLIINEKEIKSTVNFWKAVEILLTKPFALNRNIGGCELFNLGIYSNDKEIEIKKFVESSLLNFNLIEYNAVKKVLYNNHMVISNLAVKSKCLDLSTLSTTKQNILFLRLTYPRNGIFRKDIFDLVNCDFNENSATFTKIYKANDRPHLLPDLSFTVKCNNEVISLLIPHTNEEQESLQFLKSILFPKLLSWIEADLKEQIHSLRLVEVDDYFVLYNKLKKVYVPIIKEIWTECTNVEKYIHEDIAIAAYLILLWGKKPQNFVDLGCGNGLLVHILNSEGHNGIGIDVRARKIWSNYPKTTVLKVMTITPSDNSLFPEADWIIGNHSDELSPWIPVITLRSSYKTNFFLLPCCAYEFDGRKYSRSNTSKSQYLDYLDYIQIIAKKCGFNTLQDRLRIPSTKRICFVSFGRTYSECEPIQIDREVTKLIYSQSQSTADSSGKWLLNYKTREVKEKVNNCTQLDKQLVNDIISHVSNLILKDVITNEWNEGVPIMLSDIVKSIPENLLFHLKNECGGIQTLLRNHHHIFLIENGKVKFRKPIEKPNNIDKWKKKSCWFFSNHPDSCPLSNERCSYKHKEEN